jgi:hypothetical protein
MSSKPVARKRASAEEAPDARFVPVAKALARTPGFSLMESKSRAMRGLMHKGKSFGMSSHGRFILKLTPERAEALIADGVGKPFEPSAGRILKGWIEVTQPKADWVALAKEALRLSSASTQRPSPKTKRQAPPTARRR